MPEDLEKAWDFFLVALDEDWGVSPTQDLQCGRIADRSQSSPRHSNHLIGLILDPPAAASSLGEIGQIDRI